jgi:Amino acid synthesis
MPAPIAACARRGIRLRGKGRYTASGHIANTPTGASPMLHMRKTRLLRETITSDMGRAANRPIVRAVAMTVIDNPVAGRYADDLTALFEAGRAVGEQLMPELIRLLSQSPVSYGKGAIVGLNGEFEHGGACIHPMLGKPMRAAVGGGKAVIPSNVKVAACGASLDVPLSHKDDHWSF